MAKDFFSIGDDIHQPTLKKGRSYNWIDEHLMTGDENSKKIISDNFETKKIQVVFIVISIFLILLFGRIFSLQILNGAEYRASAEENRIRITDIKAPRGNIYDRNFTELSHNVPNFSLNVIPGDFSKNPDEKNKTFNSIAKILSVSPELIANKINNFPKFSYQKFSIAERIPYEQATRLMIDSNEWQGVSLDVNYSREYFDNINYSHILGYMGKISKTDLQDHPEYAYDDIIGKMGIEKQYDFILRGENGKKEIEVDSIGKETKIVNIKNPQVGKSIVLTIDAPLQKILSEQLSELVDKTKKITGAAAIAMDPKTGEILSLVSSPSFDNNAITRGLTEEEYKLLTENTKKPLFNRGITGEYPSGSTIKPVIAAAALAEGIIKENTLINSVGGIKVGEWFFPDWKPGGHGATDVKKAISESVNTFFYTIGGGFEEFEGLGIDRLTQYFNLFGLGQKLGVDLANEADGFIPSKQWKESNKKERWYIGDTYHLSIGQGDILVTPLQVAAYTSTIANGGTLYRPFLARAFSAPDQKIIQENNPLIIRNDFINKKYLDIVKKGMREAVLTGSATSLSSLPVSAAAKTGTAQFGSNNETHAWFTAFAPYENPEIVITVVVEAGGEGHATALPVAKSGLEYWFTK